MPCLSEFDEGRGDERYDIPAEERMPERVVVETGEATDACDNFVACEPAVAGLSV